MSAPISSMMERQVRSVDMDKTVAQVERLFAEHRLSWAPVLDDKGVVIGVISAADLLQFHVQGRDATAVRAWQLSTYKPLVVDPDTPAGEVARKMVEQRIHHVVVMAAEGITGVVSSLDFVRSFAENT